MYRVDRGMFVSSDLMIWGRDDGGVDDVRPTIKSPVGCRKGQIKFMQSHPEVQNSNELV